MSDNSPRVNTGASTAQDRLSIALERITFEEAMSRCISQPQGQECHLSARSFGPDSAALRTNLRRVVRGNFYQLGASIRYFAFKHIDKSSPTCIGYGFSKPALLGGPVWKEMTRHLFVLFGFWPGQEVLNIQIFCCNQAVITSKAGRQLMVEIPPWIFYFAVSAGQGLPRLTLNGAGFGQMLHPGLLALDLPQVLLGLSKKARVCYLHTVGLIEEVE